MASKDLKEFLEENNIIIHPYLYYENMYNALLQMFRLDNMPHTERYIKRYENIHILLTNKTRKQYEQYRQLRYKYCYLQYMLRTYIVHMFSQAHCNPMFRSYIQFFHREMYSFSKPLCKNIDKDFFGPEFIFSEINQ